MRAGRNASCSARFDATTCEACYNGVCINLWMQLEGPARSPSCRNIRCACLVIVFPMGVVAIQPIGKRQQKLDDYVQGFR